MSALQQYFLAYTFLRSVSNGVDHQYDTSLSMALSLTALAVGVIAACRMRHARIHRRIFTLLLCLSVFVAISGLSFAVNADAGNIINQYAAWYAMFRYVYLLMFVILLSSVYRQQNFCLNLHHVYVLLLFIISVVGLGQYLTGHAEFVTKYDKYPRVAGLSSHPVPYSLEIVLTFCVCELSRWKIRLPIRHFHIVAYMVFLAALILSASRTGVALLGLTIGIFLFAQRPSLLPAAAATFAMLLWLTPFGELFSDLKDVPDYILRGEYVVWDWRTAVTSVHWRIHHWYYLSTLGLEQPWIGYGPGQEIFYSPFALEAHNQFVEIFFEGGMVGLISFAAFWFSIPLVAMSNRQRLVIASGKKSAEIGTLHLWNAMFAGVTMVALFDQSFNQETVGLSHLIVSMFIVLAQPEAITERDHGSNYLRVSMGLNRWGAEERSEPLSCPSRSHRPIS
jgi:hypothetical protein